MTNCPVQSMTNGGALWFEDLTISDPFCLLPVLTGASLFYQVSLHCHGTVGGLAPQLVKFRSFFAHSSLM